MPTTLQSFKLLATRCATTTAATTQSPTASPVLRLRRRKTLRMLLHHDPPETTDADVRVRSKLKDLLLSSPPPPPIKNRHDHDGLPPSSAATGPTFRFRTGSRFRRGGAAGTSAFRQRLLRRAWRPVLLSIPE
ncbi:uncharacterized protein LOC109816735 [Cajanus cajan]|uniref:uncharacterized protein LOC109816735 n=1 Tax=Cajanus cajan TaxID=3821 RepID=UPI00098D9E6D|nr:uncharacterized protein LOC109816735 [Cajanus cajan]